MQNHFVCAPQGTPRLYKAPPARELSEADRATLAAGGTLAPTAAPGGIAGTGVTVFADVTAHVAPPPPPATAAAYSKKSEEHKHSYASSHQYSIFLFGYLMGVSSYNSRLSNGHSRMSTGRSQVSSGLAAASGHGQESLGCQKMSRAPIPRPGSLSWAPAPLGHSLAAPPGH